MVEDMIFIGSCSLTLLVEMADLCCAIMEWTEWCSLGCGCLLGCSVAILEGEERMYIVADRPIRARKSAEVIDDRDDV